MCADIAGFYRLLNHQSVVLQAGVTFTKPQRARSADPAVEMSCNSTCGSWEREEHGGKPPWREQADVVSAEGMQSYCKSIPRKESLTKMIQTSIVSQL